MRSPRVHVAVAAATVAAALVLGACSSSEPEPAASPSASASVPDDFDLPAGVTLTPAGTKAEVGSPATVVYELGDRVASAVTVTVAEIRPGSIEDFAFFSLDAASKKASPYYVRVSVKNEGPAGLGGAALPIYALDSTNTNQPANDIVGTFKPCPTATLPESFLPGSTAELCLVYLVPEGRTLRSVNLQTGSTADAIRWTP